MKVLVVDDNEDVRTMIKDLLLAKNINVETATDGLSGVQKVKQNKYDLVILDIKMPSLDGVKFLNVFNRLNKPLDVLVVSSYITKDLIVQLKNAGVKGYLAKPFSPESLYQSINKVCGTNIDTSFS